MPGSISSTRPTCTRAARPKLHWHAGSLAQPDASPRLEMRQRGAAIRRFARAGSASGNVGKAPARSTAGAASTAALPNGIEGEPSAALPAPALGTALELTGIAGVGPVCGRDAPATPADAAPGATEAPVGAAPAPGACFAEACRLAAIRRPPKPDEPPFDPATCAGGAFVATGAAGAEPGATGRESCAAGGPEGRHDASNLQTGRPRRDRLPILRALRPARRNLRPG